MGRLLIIGCGGVAGVAIHKCCQNSDTFTEICIASRTKSKCDALKEKLEGTTKTVITTAQVDADNVEELKALINSYKPQAVLNVGLPYQDLTIMDACLACGVDYIDTANYEPEDTDDPEWRAIYEKRCKDEGFTAYFDYSWQWAYKERFDKDNFIKNLLLDNLLLVDIYNRAKKLHIETDVKRIVFIIETKTEKDTNALETVRTLFSSKTKDFITAVDEKNIILVKEIKPSETYEDMRKTAKVIVDMLNTEAMSSVNVAYGTIVNEIKEVSRSYKEAKLALDVGKIFYSDRKIIAYSNLGIGRLIYQLPLPLCKMFIKEIFDGKSPDEFDEETLTTINKFFENSLNVSETSRQLYIHRNTLVYRLDKLQKSTGLDLRVFEDAITFKIALMVVKYMKYMESLEY